MPGSKHSLSAARSVSTIPGALRQRCGDFHFDSQRSRAEDGFSHSDRPSTWQVFRDFCLEQFRRQDQSVLEISPVRELIEEFKDVRGFTCDRINSTGSRYGLCSRINLPRQRSACGRSADGPNLSRV